MFGIGFEELTVIGLLALVLFGPQKLPGMARDFGRFVSGAQNTVEEFKSELLSEELSEARRGVEEFKSEVISKEVNETRHAVEEFESELVSSGEDRDEAARSAPLSSDDENRVRKRGEERKSLQKEEAPSEEAHTQKERHRHDVFDEFNGFSLDGLTIDTRRRDYKLMRRLWGKRILGGRR